MKNFHCDHCQHLAFFENVQCVKCGHRLAYLPDLGVVGSLDPASNDTWRSPLPRAAGRSYRLCRNYAQQNVCNWALPAEDPSALCLSCQLTRVIPDLSRPGHREAWYKLEVAKRRLVYTLVALGLPLSSQAEGAPPGLAFNFLADPENPAAPRVLTGHAGGVITLSLAEANDAERERRRVGLGEPYRTLLGHFRHESGHYYFDRLVAGQRARLAAFRNLFGDERADYGAALRRHYAAGPPANWPERYVSGYAASHPWEDWAETWAHYLHMADALETAAACGLSVTPRRADEPAVASVPNPATQGAAGSFDNLLAALHTLTYVLNNLNRGLGLPDSYPFVLPAAAVEKLRFVHETVGNKG